MDQLESRSVWDGEGLAAGMPAQPGRTGVSAGSPQRIRLRSSCLQFLCVLLLTWASVASSQVVPAPAPLIYFRTVPSFEPSSSSFIGAYVPGQPGYRPIVPAAFTGGRITWMQLVPGTKRIYWSEDLFLPPSTFVTTYWSARADGADLRGEPDLTNAQIGPSGLWKYDVDAATSRFARSRIDGSQKQVLGFGPPASTYRQPFVDPSEQRIYYFAPELSPRPGQVPRLALLRGNIATGVVQSVLIPGRHDPGGSHERGSLQLVFDLLNDRVHVLTHGSLFSDFSGPDFSLHQFDSRSFAQTSSRDFAEGEGSMPQFAIDSVNRNYYFAEAGCVSLPRPLRRLGYGALAVYQPPASIVLDNPAIGLISQMDSHPAIHVPEPSGAMAGWLALGWMAALSRRRSAAQIRLADSTTKSGA
ncbi:hypothetical protein K2X89_02575 [Myxococcota bacterium]|nr:hypothetical protein [Myxococcota bacterium]